MSADPALLAVLERIAVALERLSIKGEPVQFRPQYPSPMDLIGTQVVPPPEPHPNSATWAAGPFGRHT